jgi:uncharacterized membrane protein YozB (DUF420 family)
MNTQEVLMKKEKCSTAFTEMSVAIGLIMIVAPLYLFVQIIVGHSPFGTLGSISALYYVFLSLSAVVGTILVVVSILKNKNKD